MKKLLLCLVLVALLVSFGIPAAPALADDVTEVRLVETAQGKKVNVGGYGYMWVGLFHMSVDTEDCQGGEPYDGWCVDPDKDISRGQCFDANLVNAPGETPWCEIAYIMTNFSPTSNNEAAAIQLAIWKYIKGGKDSINALYPPAVETRADDIYEAAETRTVNLFGRGMGLTLDLEGVGGANSQDFMATVTGSTECLEGIAVDFSTTAGNLSSPTVLTNASGEAAVTLSWGDSLPVTTVTACTEGEWPVIIDPLDPNIQDTVILKPSGLCVEKMWEPDQETGSIKIYKEDGNDQPLGGSAFTITDNPKDWSAAPLVVVDNGTN
ncbi:MAG TPA: hypothetical protein G4N93_06330, partial [Dehalococcoidia bacterium]|nr:hypothetical protein [Dehalococcoidia bacterium]